MKGQFVKYRIKGQKLAEVWWFANKFFVPLHGF
jgi:hypothetical protein